MADLMLHQAFQGGFERRYGKIFIQFAQGITRGLAQAARGGGGVGLGHGDLHPDLNSSNLATPCLEEGNKFRSHLAQFGCDRTVECCDDYHLVV